MDSSANIAPGGKAEGVMRVLRDRFKDAMAGRIAIAFGWTAFGTILSQIIRLVTSLIMTRLLVPEMFGTMSIVLSVQITIALFLDIGLRPAIIQSPRGNDPVFLNTAWTVQIVRGFLIWVFIAVLASLLPTIVANGWVAADSAWAAPELPLVLIIASFAGVITGFDSTNIITAERKLALKRLFLVRLSGQLLSFFVMVLIGWLTGSIWSLVIGVLVTSLAVTILSHTVLPGIRNRLLWNWQALCELIKYGSWVFLSSAAFIVATQFDRIFLAGAVDSATLGFYSIALNLAMIVELLVGTCVSGIFLAALSEAHRQSHQAMVAKYFSLKWPLDIGVLFVAGGVFASGPVLIDILFDDRYQAAGAILQTLALMLIFTRYTLTTAAYMAMGRPDLMAGINLIRCVTLICMLFTAYHFFGFIGALYAIALHMILPTLVMFVLNHSRGLNNFKLEAVVLVAWPIGFALGLIFNAFVGLF